MAGRRVTIPRWMRSAAVADPIPLQWEPSSQQATAPSTAKVQYAPILPMSLQTPGVLSPSDVFRAMRQATGSLVQSIPPRVSSSAMPLQDVSNESALTRSRSARLN